MLIDKMKFKHKLLSIPLITLIFFVLLLVITTVNNRKNQKQNDRVREGYCPAYMLTRDLEEYLTAIHIQLQQAVSTLELESLDDADKTAAQFINAIDNELDNPVLDIQVFEKLKQDLNVYYAHARQTTEKMIGGHLGGSIMDDLSVMNGRYESIRKQLEINRKDYESKMKINFDQIRANNTRSMLVMILFILVSMAMISGASFWIAETLTGNVKMMVEMMKNIAKGEGDLTRRLPIHSGDELGDLANWFNLFVEKLHAIIHQIRTNTINVSNAVLTITETTSQMAAGAEEHNAQAGEVASSVEEMTSSIMQNSQSASQTSKIAEEAGYQVTQGVEAMQTSRHGMDRIVNASAKMEDIIRSLTDRALQIGEITQVIDKIADQTNLLALNAAVEAARAGDQGSGFAVVADEVRKLAERTAVATRQIASTIESIQKDTIEASESMMETKDAVDSGQIAMEQTESMLGQILESVNKAVEMIHQIAAASEEQSAGAEEISSSVEEMNAVAKQTSEGVEHLSTTAQELNSQTENLHAVVKQFKLNSTNGNGKQ
jgi:methyl-accepting chemotaxis protein